MLTTGNQQLFLSTGLKAFIMNMLFIKVKNLKCITFFISFLVAMSVFLPVSYVVAGELISKSGWSLVYVDSQELVGENGAAINAFDGKSTTIWHTQWKNGSPRHPHEIQIDLGNVYDIDGFRYLPRQETGEINGTIKQYAFYVSADGINWGNPVAAGAFATSTTEKQVTFSVVTGRYVRLVALSEVNGNPWTSMAELGVLGTLSSGTPGSTLIPQSGWSLLYVDSQELVGENGAAINAFDGKSTTIWHTQWKNGSPLPPHEIQIDLGDVYDIDGFRYLPRQETGEINGTIKQYAFYVSADGINWGTPVAAGTFAISTSEKQVTFSVVTGRYVRLVALSEVNGNPWTSMAELGVLGAFSSGNHAPNGTITPNRDLSVNVGDSVYFKGTGIDPEGDTPLTFLWVFDDPAIPDFTVEDPGLITFNNPGVFTVSLTVTDSLGLSDASPATRTITVTQQGSTLIPQSGWSLLYVDSQELVGENGAAINAFDGKSTTIWHTQWKNGSPLPPHEIQIDLGDVYDIDGFRYLPRQETGEINGTIKQYAFYVSSDGVNWGAPVATGTFVTSKTEKLVTFNLTTGRYVRLVALSEVNGNPWTSMAELKILSPTLKTDSYIGFGDSITKGSHDDILSDGVGYEPILSNLLSDEKGYINIVINAGVSGDQSIDGVNRIASVIAANPKALYCLIQLGTNDAWGPFPSGLGLYPGEEGYPGTFKDNMQRIITEIENAGKVPYLAKVPAAFGNFSYFNPYLQEYNQVIDELKDENNINIVPPDFYCHFTNNPYEMDPDGLHPNGTGYQSMAEIWLDTLLNQYTGCLP